MPKKVLVAPLNWGLGHATRCIPIVHELLKQGAEVVLASDGRAYELLRMEFPMLVVEKLPGYNVLYRSNNMVWNMGIQSFKILRAIFQENRQLRQLIQKHRIDCVISDNRFGCFNSNIKSIFITHQVNILLPFSLPQWLTRWANRFFMRRYDECWIPDVQGEHSLAGILAQAPSASATRYLGILSRMKPLQMPQKQDVIIVLSGPEPQRTRLEKAILTQVINLPYHFLLVQGKPELAKTQNTFQEPTPANVRIVPFLNATALNEAIAASGLVICRSGYSTIMDLAVLNKPAIFVPTPGQTEQEYLAERLMQKGYFYYQKQPELDLVRALREVGKFPGLNWEHYRHSPKQLAQIIGQLLNASSVPHEAF